MLSVSKYGLETMAHMGGYMCIAIFPLKVGRLAKKLCAPDTILGSEKYSHIGCIYANIREDLAVGCTLPSFLRVVK